MKTIHMDFYFPEDDEGVARWFNGASKICVYHERTGEMSYTIVPLDAHDLSIMEQRIIDPTGGGVY